MIRLCAIALITCAITSLSACSDDDPAPEIVTAVTYNAGLALGYVEAANQRAPLATSQVVALDADVLCVQEYWQDDHVDQLKAAAGSNYQGMEFLPPEAGNTGDAACNAGDSDELYKCAEDNCSNLCTDELTNCVLSSCAGELAQLNKDHADCYTCLAANVGKDLTIIKATCESKTTEYAYGGSFGIGLLTKKKPVVTTSKVFESSLNRRAVLHSRIQSDDGKNLDVYCTHLTSVLSDVPHPSNSEDDAWEKEQSKQIDDLLAFILETAGSYSNTILMGDFNTGPKGTKFVAEIPSHYDRLIDAGYLNPYVTNADADCTYCSNNPLNKSSGGSSTVIDHIFLGGLNDVRESRRVLDDTIEVENCGKNIETGYSDHYAVSVSFAY